MLFFQTKMEVNILLQLAHIAMALFMLLGSHSMVEMGMFLFPSMILMGQYNGTQIIVRQMMWMVRARQMMVLRRVCIFHLTAQVISLVHHTKLQQNSAQKN